MRKQTALTGESPWQQLKFLLLKDFSSTLNFPTSRSWPRFKSQIEILGWTFVTWTAHSSRRERFWRWRNFSKIFFLLREKLFHLNSWGKQKSKVSPATGRGSCRRRRCQASSSYLSSNDASARKPGNVFECNYDVNNFFDTNSRLQVGSARRRQAEGFLFRVRRPETKIV